jgi:hypothetical protein
MQRFRVSDKDTAGDPSGGLLGAAAGDAAECACDPESALSLRQIECARTSALAVFDLRSASCLRELERLRELEQS